MALADDTFPLEIFEPDEGPPFTDGDLDSYIDDHAIVDRSTVLWPEEIVLPEGDPVPRPRTWRERGITDDREAAWALEKYREALADLEAVKERHAFMVDRVESWNKRNERGPLARLAFFGGPLEAYALDRRREDPKRKTINLPNGKISTTVTAAKVDVDEAEILIAWAESAVPAAVKVERSILKTELRKAVTVEPMPTLVVLTCACIVAVEDGKHDDDEGPRLKLAEAGRSNAVTCPSCGDDALVGDWLETRLVAVDEDGDPVPGTRVEPERLTASVKPE